MQPKIYSLSQALESCPGLTGELARHLNSLQETDQPGICLVSALSFMSVLRSGRIKSKTGLSPNIYTLVLGRSGSGKTRCQQRITDICKLCNIESFLMGKPASDTGILKSIQKQPRQLLIWDEFGQALNEISQSTSSYRAAIVTTVMEIYSANGRTYIGKEYATQDRVDVKAPYLSIAAASTINEFYSALTMQFLEKGFLSRWLVVEGNHKVERKPYVAYPLSREVLGFISRLDWSSTENIPVMRFDTPNMGTLMRDLSWAKREDAKTEIEHILWSRAIENATKLCLILSDENGACSDEAARFSWYLTEYLIDELIVRCNHDVHDNQRDKQLSDRAKKFESLLAKGESITKKELFDRAHNRHIRGQEYKWLLAEQLESERWTETKTRNPSTGRVISTYSITEELKGGERRAEAVPPFKSLN